MSNSQSASTNQQLLELELQQIHIPAVAHVGCSSPLCFRVVKQHICLLLMGVNNKGKYGRTGNHLLLLGDSLKYTTASTDRVPDSWCR